MSLEKQRARLQEAQGSRQSGILRGFGEIASGAHLLLSPFYMIHMFDTAHGDSLLLQEPLLKNLQMPIVAAYQRHTCSKQKTLFPPH